MLVPRVPWITTDVVASTGVVVTAKVAVFAPRGTITVFGTNADALLELIEIVVPEDPALVERVTVHVVALPPVTATGDKASLVRV